MSVVVFVVCCWFQLSESIRCFSGRGTRDVEAVSCDGIRTSRRALRRKRCWRNAFGENGDWAVAHRLEGDIDSLLEIHPVLVLLLSVFSRQTHEQSQERLQS